LDLIKWLRKLAEEEGLVFRDEPNVSEAIRRCVELVKEIREKGLVLIKPSNVEFHLDEDTVKLLEEIAEMAGIEELYRALDLVVVSMHALIKAGVWKLLKPVPELARMILEEEK